MSESAGNCRRCGACCRQGGPALHGPDRALLHSGHLLLDDLITVRRGELALHPLAGQPEPVTREFLKLKGKQGSWCCAFYDEEARGCTRYAYRPMACGLLDCTDTGPLLAIAGKDLLTRFDCIAAGDPLLPLMHEYERLCPCPDLQTIRELLTREGGLAAPLLGELEAAISRDLAFRGRVTTHFALSVDRELFCFGRPVFHLLRPLGLQTVHTPGGLRLVMGRQ